MLDASELKAYTDNIVTKKTKADLEVIENCITKAANNGEYDCVFEDRMEDDLIAVLKNLGYVVKNEFDRTEQEYYTVISWRNA